MKPGFTDQEAPERNDDNFLAPRFHVLGKDPDPKYRVNDEDCSWMCIYQRGYGQSIAGEIRLC